VNARALQRWRSRGTVKLCLLGASALLAAARMLHRSGFVGPAQVSRALSLSSRLTQTGLRAWRSLFFSESR
jgi:hypothetical protein